MPASHRTRSLGSGNVARRAVFLDRDGVLNRSAVRNGKPYAPRLLSEFHLLPGAARAVADLKRAGFLVVVVTNQPDVGHGLISRETLEAMHQRLRKRTKVDDILVCPHRQDAGCACRKPKPGLISKAIRRWKIERNGSYMVGDRWNDIVAGKRAGLYTVHVNRGYAEDLIVLPDEVAGSLRQAVKHILSHDSRRPRDR